MDIFSPTIIKELLSKHGSKPSKGLGQNFLIDAAALKKVVVAGDLKTDDIIVEIGPGIGTLTRQLAPHVKKVIAVEKDWTMIQVLKETLKGCHNVEIINADILDISNFKLQISNSDYKVISNIPYYITSPIIRKFLEEKNQPSQIVLMVQKEVARRICAKTPDMSILAVSVQFYATAKIISYVKKGCFWPVPNVDSAIIKITPFKEPPKVNPDDFFKVVKAGFLHPRKKLINNLSEGLTIEKEPVNTWLVDNNINPAQRAETLTIENWQDLTKWLAIR